MRGIVRMILSLSQAFALASVTSGCAQASSSTTKPREPAEKLSEISEITFERQCTGCEGSFAATLRSDGSATRMFHGNARMGIAPRSLKGRVGKSDFDRLVGQLEAEGFFKLEEAYRNPRLQDGEWVQISAVRGGKPKSVLDANQAGPLNLRRIEEAVEALLARIVWVAEQGALVQS